MMCNDIPGIIIRKLQNELNVKEKKKLDKHLKKCIECRRKYYFITANYDPSLGTASCLAAKESRETDSKLIIGYNQNELIHNVMSGIDTYRYNISANRNNAQVSNNMKTKIRWAFVCLAVIISLSITAFAKPIYKSLTELLGEISINHNYYLKQATGGIEKTTPKKKTETEIKDMQKSLAEADILYDKYKYKVDEIITEMKPGELRTLNFEGERDDFYVGLGKGIESKTIIYGIKGNSGHIRVEGIPTSYRARADSKDMSIEELIHQGYFTPVLEYLPEGYEFSGVGFSKDEISSITYRNNKTDENDYNDYISIYLATDRVNIDDDAEKTLELINGYQAIYMEEEAVGNRFGKFIIYLGDNKRLKVLTLAANLKEGSLEKSDLYNMAQNIRYYNEESNEITYNGYFKNVKDTVPQQKLDEFFEKVEKGEKDIRIQLEDDVRLSRKAGSGKSETYYIEYFGNDQGKIKQYSNYPMLMNLEIFKDSMLENLAIIGFGYKWDKEVHFSIKSRESIGANKNKSSANRLNDTIARIDARVLDSRLKLYPVFDVVIDDYVSCMNSEVRYEELIFDKNNHPYIVTEAKSTDAKTGKETIFGRYFRTVKETAGDYVHYNITIPYTMLKDMSDQEFIDGLGFIE